MGLLDSVLGSVMGGSAQGAGAQGGLGSLIHLVTSNPQLLQAITGMLANDGAQGGLPGLVEKFQQAGLGNVVASWIGSGQNQPIGGDQLTQVLGSGTIGDIAARLGMGQGETADQLANLLPGLVDQLTPHGTAPANGLGDTGDLMGMLGGLLRQ
ncbi:MAG: YidB family protein [Ramlibacter sp.]